MTVVHSYIRWSDPQQSEGDSNRRQLEELAPDFCKRHRHTLSDLRFFDRGKSAYKGNKQKALDELLRAIQDGRIKSGEIVFFEAIDRLSRKGIRPTQDIVNQILNAGVSIAIAFPHERVYTPDDVNDIGATVELAAFAYAAHCYSKSLSERLASYWRNQRKRLANGECNILSRHIPAWLEYDGEKFVVIEEAATAIRYIFARTIDGLGGKQICKELNEKFRPIAKGKRRGERWNETYTRTIVRSRRVLGEHQPTIVKEDGKLVPIGDPIPNYFPRIIDDEIWLAANQALDNRRRERGPSGEFVNLFTGIVFHAIDKCPAVICSYQQRRADGRSVKFRRLISYNYLHRVSGSTTHTIDLMAMEQAVLKYLRELDVSMLKNGHKTALELQAAQQELQRKIRRIAEIQAKIKTDSEALDLLIGPLKELEAERKELQTKVQRLAAQSASTPAHSLNHLKELADMDNTPENRQRLREAIKQVVEQINVATVKLGNRRRDPVATCIEIIFRGGHRRTIALCNKQCIAYTDHEPPKETLATRKDLKSWLKKFEKAMRQLFMPSKPR